MLIVLLQRNFSLLLLRSFEGFILLETLEIQFLCFNLNLINLFKTSLTSWIWNKIFWLVLILRKKNSLDLNIFWVQMKPYVHYKKMVVVTISRNKNQLCNSVLIDLWWVTNFNWVALKVFNNHGKVALFNRTNLRSEQTQTLCKNSDRNDKK